MIATDTIPPEVLELVGVPYRHRCADPARGLDCLTLLAEVFDRLGRAFPLPRDYSPEAVPAAELARVHESLEPLEAPEAWAVVEFGGGHCGVVLPGCSHVLHASPERGVAVHRLGMLRPHVTGFYRLEGDPDG